MSGAKLISFGECCSGVSTLMQCQSQIYTQFFQQKGKYFREYFCPGCGTLEQFHILARVASGVCFYFLQMTQSYWNYQTVNFNSHLDPKHLG